jgi:hypothetical protein
VKKYRYLNDEERKWVDDGVELIPFTHYQPYYKCECLQRHIPELRLICPACNRIIPVDWKANCKEVEIFANRVVVEK